MSFKNNKREKVVMISLAIIVCGVVVYYAWPTVSGSFEYIPNIRSLTKDVSQSSKSLDTIPPLVSTPSSQLPVIHIQTPEHVKAVYMSAWVAGSARYRDPVIKLVDDTELNAVIVDVKDSTGYIGFHVNDPELTKEKSSENRIKDIRALTNMLHQKNIYIIGRIAVFQDPFMTKKRPEWAITKKSDGTVWKDRKGLSFLDPANKQVWKYIVSIAHEAYAQGFDEINFDYIRYPSDGNIKDINYHIAKGRTRADNLKDFFAYLSQEVKKDNPIPMSADLFGLTTEVNDDMGIGQVWENALPYFDFLAPMIYPSHYPAGQAGFKNPAEHPYEIINIALIGAVKKTKAAVPVENINKIRPWLQDFNLGAKYTSDMVRLEKKAVYDNSLHSWMLWDPNNRYTPGALDLEVKP